MQKNEIPFVIYVFGIHIYAKYLHHPSPHRQQI